MRVLEYTDLDVSRVRKAYDKTRAQLEQGDFRSAQVKKLATGNLYRARLDDSNRLLFTLRRSANEAYVLALEVVHNHAYDKAKFLRGALVDESKIADAWDAVAETASSADLIVSETTAHRFHVLDKIIVFDAAQQDTVDARPPLIVIGPAGSGKTAVVLEQMKRFRGRVLYVTLSPYLAEHARGLLHAGAYDTDALEADFLSFREYLESIEVPAGKQVTFGSFAAWVNRFPKQQRPGDAHKLYEEFRGVMTGMDVTVPWLSRDAYRALGVRQSIFNGEEREQAYGLFEKYLAHLEATGTYDPNIIAHGYASRVTPSYDLVIVDEVQDVTNVQLDLVLRSAKAPDGFILSGDSNQVVHPNFFSWAGLKRMFYEQSASASQIQRILTSNYRNAIAVIDASNLLLRIKQRRFGSIDRESNYLMTSATTRQGHIELLADDATTLRDLNERSRRSSRVAVIVMRDEDKAAAREHFKTPLVFSVHEAKGLEYESIILWNLVSNDRAQFTEVCRDIAAEDLTGELTYVRNRDKTDKSLEAYKFYVNALYVALTRAVERVILVEHDVGHPLFRLLGVAQAGSSTTLKQTQSTTEEWQAEAHRLELQGKAEQADDIRKRLLGEAKVPWEVIDDERIAGVVERALAKNAGAKLRQTLFEYALVHDAQSLIIGLKEAGFDRARDLVVTGIYRGRVDREKALLQRRGIMRKHFNAYESKAGRDVLRACDQYGVDHRTIFNRTPLMVATDIGNVSLVHALLDRGANIELIDTFGFDAWQIALMRAIFDRAYNTEVLPALYERLAAASLALRVNGKLIKIDRAAGEYMLVQAMFVYTRFMMSVGSFNGAGFSAVDLTEVLALFPHSVVPAYRAQRQYVSSLLSKNELNSTSPYGRRIFLRVRHGRYVIDPELACRVGDAWQAPHARLRARLLTNLVEQGDHGVDFVEQMARRMRAPAAMVDEQQEQTTLFGT